MQRPVSKQKAELEPDSARDDDRFWAGPLRGRLRSRSNSTRSRPLRRTCAARHRGFRQKPAHQTGKDRKTI